MNYLHDITSRHKHSLHLALISQLVGCRVKNSRIPDSIPGFAKFFHEQCNVDFAFDLVVFIELLGVLSKKFTLEFFENNLPPFMECITWKFQKKYPANFEHHATSSVYCDITINHVPQELLKILENKKGSDIHLAMDANAYSHIWGSVNFNSRRKMIDELTVSCSLLPFINLGYVIN